MVRTYLIALSALFVVTVPALAAEEAIPAADPAILHVIDADARPSRGLILPVLYASYGALQAYDGYSTVSATRLGGIEANPLMAGVAGRPGAVWAVKVGITVATMTTAERLWRQGRRTQSIVVMLAANGVMAAVAANNASVLRGMK